MTTGVVPWGSRLARGNSTASVDFSLVCLIFARAPQDSDKASGVERLFLDTVERQFYYHSGTLADAWQAIGGDATAQIDTALDIVDVTVNSGATFETTLRSQETDESALLMYIAADLDHTVDGTRYAYSAPTILYVPPRSMAVNVLFSRAQIGAIVNAVEENIDQRVLVDEAVGADTVGKIVIEQGQSAFVTQEITHPDRPATFDVAEYTDSSYLGIINYEPQASGRTLGDWRIVPTSWHVRRVASFSSAFGGNYLAWVDATFAAVGINGYLGEYATEAEAASHVTANGQYYIDTAVPQLMVTSNYVAGSSAQRTEYKRHDLATADAVNDLARRAIHNSLKSPNIYLGDRYDTAPFRVYQADGLPGILNVADLDGDYSLVLKRPEALVENIAALDTPTKRARIDELRIFIFNGGVGTVVHRVSPWAYAEAAQTIDFAISAAEETGAASRITGDEVIFRVVAYADNGAVGNPLTYSMPINPAFEPPDSGGVDQTARDAAAAADDKAVAAQATADANTATIDRLAVFGQYELNPAGIPDGNPPDFIALTLSTKRVNKVIDRLQVNLGGVIMFDARRIARPVPPATDPLAQFNFAANDYEASGGVVNLAFPTPADKINFTNAASGTVAMRDQFVHGVITYTFTDGTVESDRIHFGVNNNAFRSTASGLDQDAVDARVQAAKGTAAPGNTPGTPAAGTSARWSPQDHDHGITPGTGGGGLNQAQVDARVRALALLRSGGTMTGALTLAGDPTANLHAATKQYIDNLLSALGDNLLVDDSASPIPPTDANADKILVRGGRLFENVLHSATDPQVTYRDFATSDLPAGDTWGGAFQVSPSASSTAARTVIYSIPGAHFLVRVSAVAAYGGYSVANWRGPAADKAEADESVTAIGDVVYYGGTVRVVTAFTAGTSRSRSWVPIVTVPAEASVTFDTLAAALLATQAEVASGETNKIATAAIIKAYVEAQLSGLPQLGSQVLAYNATLDMNPSAGYTGLVTLTGNTTFNITDGGRPGGNVGDVAELLVTQDGTGSRTLTLHSSIRRYHGVAAPRLTTDANAIDHLLFKQVTPTAWYYMGMKRVA